MMTPIRRPVPEPRLDALLRYVSGASPLAEAESIRIWAAGDPDREATIEEIRAAWMQETTSPAWDKAGVWDRLAREMSDAEGPKQVAAARVITRRPPILRRYAERSTASRWYLAAAAAIAVLTGGGIFATMRHQSQAVVPTASAVREIATTRGEQATLDLADGTRVTLAADSRLRIPASFDKAGSDGIRRRDLELTGRAFFDVAHDASKPFVVHTATAVTKDIGTAFVISAYPETHATEVVVVSGSVGLWNPPRVRRVQDKVRKDALMVLTSGDLATLDTSGTATRIRNVSLSRYTSWMGGALVFDHTPVREAIREMERWYDVDIRVDDGALLDRRLTATIRDETADQAMQHLALTLDVNMHRTGRHVTFVPRNGPTH